MNKHRDSQKRIYQENAVYFITCNIQDRFPFFSPEEPSHRILCSLLVEELRLAKRLKKFESFAFTTMYNHIHLIIKPGNTYNVSKCIHTIKRHFSRDCNILLGYENINKTLTNYEGEHRDARLRVNKVIQNNIGNRVFQSFPKFKWQRSFHDHIIRNQKDFDNHFNYIANNHLKHSDKYKYPPKWKYAYPNENGNTFNGLIDVYE